MPANYAAFVQSSDGNGFDMRPQAYALLAFIKGGHGRPIAAKAQLTTPLDFDAYAYRDHDGSLYVTLINKSYGNKAGPHRFPSSSPQGSVRAHGSGWTCCKKITMLPPRRA